MPRPRGVVLDVFCYKNRRPPAGDATPSRRGASRSLLRNLCRKKLVLRDVSSSEHELSTAQGRSIKGRAALAT
jgi:hypothetical protein